MVNGQKSRGLITLQCNFEYSITTTPPSCKDIKGYLTNKGAKVEPCISEPSLAHVHINNYIYTKLVKYLK